MIEYKYLILIFLFI